MSLFESNFSCVNNNQGFLIKLLIERLNPAGWPIQPRNFPPGTALVGGAIRDALLNNLKHKPDLDFIVPSGAIKLTEQLALEINGRCVILDSKRDIARLVVKGWTVDLASQVGLSLKDDLSRRDYTINSIAITFDPSPKIFDPNNGINHLKDRKLIAVSEKNLIEDPLRLLRGFRLSAELNLQLDLKTISWIKAHKSLLKNVARERIKFELERLVNGLWADEVVQRLQQIGLLDPWSPKKNDLKTFSLPLKNISTLNANEKEIAVPLIFLIKLLSNEGLNNLGFSRKKVKQCNLLRYWHSRNDGFAFKSLSELDRIQLHKDLENILPALILQLSTSDQEQWLIRWRNAKDPLFHPFSPLDGDTLKAICNDQQGLWIGQLMNFLCKENAFGRIKNREEAYELSLNWWKQNQPFYD